MIEPAAAVGLAPVIHRAIAPPGVELGRLRREHAHAVDPVAGVARKVEHLAFDRRVRDHLDHLLVAPYVVLERRHIEIAHQNGALGFRRTQVRMRAHLVQKRKLMLEFRIDLGIRLVAARRHVEIMQRDWIAQRCALAQRHRDMAAVGLAAEALHVNALERQAREHGDAVIALLPVERGVLVAEPLKALERKGVVRAFRFLQAEYVGAGALKKLGDQVDAQADGIDVPGGDLEGHGSNILTCHAPRKRGIQYLQIVQ